MNNFTTTCIYCNHSEQTSLRPQYLPILIHKADQFVNKLPVLEIFKPS